MKLSPNEVRLIPLTNYEILMVIETLRKNIPNKNDEQAVINVVTKLQTSVGLS